MGPLLFVAIVLAICVGWWLTVYAAPHTLSLLLPKGGLVFGFGFAIFAAGLANAALAVYGLGQPQAFIGALLTSFWGGWFMLAPTAARRSSPEDLEMMERLGVMLLALMCVLVSSFFATREAVLGLQLWLVLFGAVVATRKPAGLRR